MGSIFHLPVIPIEDTVNTVNLLKQAGFSIIAATTKAQDEGIQPPQYPAALILGSEAGGIRESVLQMADFRYSITGSGRAESLNVAVAGGIIMEKLSRGISLFKTEQD